MNGLDSRAASPSRRLLCSARAQTACPLYARNSILGYTMASRGARAIHRAKIAGFARRTRTVPCLCFARRITPACSSRANLGHRRAVFLARRVRGCRSGRGGEIYDDLWVLILSESFSLSGAMKLLLIYDAVQGRPPSGSLGQIIGTEHNYKLPNSCAPTNGACSSYSAYSGRGYCPTGSR